jgi:hypothetical protein
MGYADLHFCDAGGLRPPLHSARTKGLGGRLSIEFGVEPVIMQRVQTASAETKLAGSR